MKKLFLLILLFPFFIKSAEEFNNTIEEFEDFQIVGEDSKETEENRAFTILNKTDEVIEIAFKPNDLVPSIFLKPNDIQIIGLNDKKYNLIYIAYFSQIKEFWARPNNKNIRSSNLVKIISGKNYVVTYSNNNQLQVIKQ